MAEVDNKYLRNFAVNQVSLCSRMISEWPVLSESEKKVYAKKYLKFVDNFLNQTISKGSPGDGSPKIRGQFIVEAFNNALYSMYIDKVNLSNSKNGKGKNDMISRVEDILGHIAVEGGKALKIEIKILPVADYWPQHGAHFPN